MANSNKSVWVATMENAGTEAREFGKRLRSTRIRKGFKKARHFATQLGVNENTYYRYERGSNAPSLDMLRRMCELLQVPICELLNFSGGIPSQCGRSNGYTDQRAKGLGEQGQSEYRSNRAIRVQEQCNRADDAAPLFVDCSMSAWELAELITELKFAQGRERISSEHKLLACASIYLKLKNDPFGTVSRILEEGAVAIANEDLLERLSRGVDRYTRAYRAYHGSVVLRNGDQSA